MSEKIGAIDRALEVEELGDQAYDPDKEGELPERQFLLVHAVTIGIAMVCRFSGTFVIDTNASRSWSLS
jgi:hypothetical protein